MVDDGYTSMDTIRLVGITYRQLDYWDRTNLVRPSIVPTQGTGIHRLYSFDDLAKVATVKALLDHGMSLPAIRQVVATADMSNPTFTYGGAAVVTSVDVAFLRYCLLMRIAEFEARVAS